MKEYNPFRRPSIVRNAVFLHIPHRHKVLFVCFFVVVILVFVCFVASDVLTTICHLAIVNVRVIIIMSIGNTQISILLLCLLYLFVELIITMIE